MNLLQLARSVIEAQVHNQSFKKPENYPEELNEKKGVFVTLTINNQLRGCIGLPYPEKPLIDALIEASKEVCHDPRFPPLTENELPKVRIEISILSTPKPVKLEDIKKGDGIILKKGFNSALYLPQVWKQLPTKNQFLTNLAEKAGLSDYHNAEFYKFSVKVLEE
jgi:AmmeMemoRadiSam system protein A